MKIRRQILGVAVCLALVAGLHAQGGNGGRGGNGGTGGIQAPFTPQLQILTTSLPSTVVGATYSQTLQAAFGVGTLTWSETGTLPSGLTLSSVTGVISGTVGNNAGNYAFTVSVKDSSVPQPQVATQNLNISVLCTPLLITSPQVWPTADQGTAYNFTVQTSGGILPLTFSASGLPSPESINSSTGVVSGTPSVNGSFSNIVVTVSDSCPTSIQTVSGTFTELVNTAIAITTPPILQAGTTGVAYSTQLAAAGGTLPYTNWAVTAGSLPAGLSIAAATGVISGTPTGTGTSNFTITVTDSASGTASLAMSLTVACPALSIATPNLPNGTQNQQYSFQEQASGGFGAISWTGTDFPSGIGISNAGLVSGTTGLFGTFTPNIIATDSCPGGAQSANITPTLTIAQAVGQLQITTTSPLPDETVGQAVNVNMQAQGGVPPYVWSQPSGSFPPGVGMNSQGAITGTPTQSGTFTPQIQVTDTQPVTVGPLPFTITVNCPSESITTTSLPPGTNGTAYSFTVQGTGGFGTITWSQSGLPTGLSIGSSTGTISGTPTVSGTFSVTITRTDSCAPVPTAVSLTLPLQINNPPLAITTTSLPNGTLNQFYSTTLTGTGGTPPYTWSITAGVLQTGLSLNGSTGVISGTPTATGTVNLTIQLADNASHTVTASFPLTVNAASGADNRYCSTSGTWVGPASDGGANAPQKCVRTALADMPATGPTVNITAGSCSSMQSNINKTTVTPGTTFVIPSLNGANQNTTTCVLKPAAACSATNWCYITTDSTALSNFPAEGTRISPAWVGITSIVARPAYNQPTTAGTYMPKLICNGNFCIQFQGTAAYWVVRGLEITSPSGSNASQLVQGVTGWNHIVLVQDDIHGGNSIAGQDRDDIQAGIAFGACQFCGIVDSFIYDTHCGGKACSQSQGIVLGGNSTIPTGPTKVVNNFDESAGENIFSGGAGAQPPIVIQPSTDTEIRRNDFFKPLIWKQNDPSFFGTKFELDNLMELKNSQRVFVEGNWFDGSVADQGTQQGNAVIFGPRNQSSGFTGTASSDGSGNITWLTGTKFNANETSSSCGVDPGHCLFVYSGLAYEVASFTSSTQVTLQLCKLGCVNAGGILPGTTLPPLTQSANFIAYNPGLNPNAIVNDAIFRYNIITHADRVGSIATGVSNGGDLPLSLKRVSIHDNTADGIDGLTWATGVGACCVWATGWQIAGASPTIFPDNIFMNHNTLITFLNCPNVNGCVAGLGPDFMWGLNQAQLMTSFIVTNNIAAGGVNQNKAAEAAIVASTQKAGLCWDHNFLATTDNPLGPNGNTNPLKQFATGDNPPYPIAGDNGGCSFAATGNTSLADYNAVKFTNLNSGVAGNYQLLSSSPAHNQASDGTDAGANIPLLNTYTAGVRTGGITQGGGGPSPNANWQLAFTNPSNITQPNDFAIGAANEWYLADRLTGFWKSTNQGASWTQINSGIIFNPPPAGEGWTIQYNLNDGSLIASIGGTTSGNTVHFYRSTNDGASWTLIDATGYHNTTAGAASGCAMPPASGGNLACGGWFGSNNTSEFYSSNNGATTTLGSYNPAVSSVLGLARNPIDGSFWTGTENGGIFRSADGGVTAINVFANQSNPSNGDTWAIAFDKIGNALLADQGGVWRGVGTGTGPYTWTNTFGGFTSQGRAIMTDSLNSVYYSHSPNANFPNTVMRSLNNGLTFSPFDQGLPQQLEVHHFEENPNDGMIYAVVENGSTNAANVYRTPK